MAFWNRRPGPLALIVATEHGVMLEVMGDPVGVCGWTADDLVGSLISTKLIPEGMRDAHADGLAHYRETGDGPVLNQTLPMEALGPDQRARPVWLTVFGFEEYSRLVYGLLEKR